MAPPPLRRYGLRWVTEKEDRILTLGLGFMFDAQDDCNLNIRHDIEEEEADCRPTYDSRGVDITKTKEPEGINSLVLSLRINGVSEEQLQHLKIDYTLSKHSQALCRVGPGYEEPLDDDVATERRDSESRLGHRA
ncbi:hypothetical protein HAX54_029014 [Datura stramonium]|uniref:Uncharacterized protein n=1 Tax=Datura stramonium TaxID=4076 RepID=A0ABS8S9Z0_DATST|nr:hypothetical protein [Datura stramonium]